MVLKLFSFSLSFFPSLVCVCVCVCQDPMGEEHHIRRTSGVPPFMVVVSVVFIANVSIYILLNTVFSFIQIPDIDAN